MGISSSIKMKYFGLIGIVIFAFILSGLDLSKLIGAAYGANIYLLVLGMFLSFVPFLVRSGRWNMIIRHMVGKKLPFSSTLYFWLNSLIVGLITPGRIGEILMRSKYIKNSTEASMGKSFSTVVIDRLSDVSFFLAVSILGVLYVTILLGKDVFSLLFGLLIVCVALALFVASLMNKRLLDRFLRIFFRALVPPRMKNSVKVNYNEFFDALRGFSAARIAYMIILSFMAFFASIVSYYVVSLGLGMNVPFLYLAIVVPITYMVTLIPISVSGLGTREASYIFLFSLVGVSPELSLIFSLLDMILLNWISTLMAYGLSHIIRT